MGVSQAQRLDELGLKPEGGGAALPSLQALAEGGTMKALAGHEVRAIRELVGSKRKLARPPDVSRGTVITWERDKMKPGVYAALLRLVYADFLATLPAPAPEASEGVAAVNMPTASAHSRRPSSPLSPETPHSLEESGVAELVQGPNSEGSGESAVTHPPHLDAFRALE